MVLGTFGIPKRLSSFRAATDVLKQSVVYRYGRIAAFAMLGEPRFYTPLSAARHLARSEGGSRRSAPHVVTLRKEGDLTIWQTPLGVLATNEAEDRRHLEFLVREFERNVYLGGPARIRNGDVVLDVGANIGLFSRQAAAAGARRVIALEPTPATARAFKWNLASSLNDGVVSLLGKGAWDSHDTLPFTVNPGRPGSSSLVDPPSVTDAYVITIDVAPLDFLVCECGLDRVDFIKMDIEGAETLALQGAAETLRKYKPQLAVAVEHTDDLLRNAAAVRDIVLRIEPSYRCIAGPFTVTERRTLAPEILFFV